MSECFQGSGSEHLARKFIVEQCKHLIDPSDLNDFVLFERNPKRILEIANRLVKHLTEVSPERIPVPCKQTEKQTTKEVESRVMDKVEKNIDKHPNLVQSLKDLPGVHEKLHLIWSQGVISQDELDTLLRDENLSTLELQRLITKHSTPHIFSLVEQLHDEILKQKVYKALSLSKSDAKNALTLLAQFLENCKSLRHQITSFFKHHLSKWTLWFGTKQLKCGAYWKVDEHVIKKILHHYNELLENDKHDST